MIINYTKPIRLIALFNVMIFALLYLKNKEIKTIYSGLAIISIIYLVYFLLKWKKWGDVYLFLIVSMLTSIGIAMIFRLDVQLGIKQIIWFSGGIALFLLSYLIFQSIKFWHKLTYFYMGISFVLFVLTLVLGSKIKGATN